MTAAIRRHNGAPTLFLDGQPTFAGYLWCAAPTPDSFYRAPDARRFAEAGLHLYAFDVGTQGNPPEWCGPGPGRNEHWDFATVEARFGQVLAADPQARFHLRVHLEMSQWWRALYPDECELGSDGQRRAQSYASAIWRTQAQAFLRAYVAHLQRVGLGERVIAYQVGAGGTGEWLRSSAMSDYCGDYSAPMQAHFCAWLRQRYQGDVAALRAAWADAGVTFEEALPPTFAEQFTPYSAATFRDPAREQKTIDYYRALADLCGDLIIDLCRTVKMATGGQALAGAFYGYLMELAWNLAFFGEAQASAYSTYQRSGHLGLRRVLRAPEVDFLVSPYSYGFRGIGGEGAPMLPTESLRLHGKLYVYEDDTRTHITQHEYDYGRVDTLSDSVSILQRNLAQVLTRGSGIWWLGGGPTTCHINPEQEPAFRPLLRRFQELGTLALSLQRAPSAEIAVLLDDESLLYESLRNDLDLPLIFQQRLWGLARLGAPYDLYLLDDFLEGALPSYKLYVFLNAFCLDGARRAALAHELRRDGHVAVWLYAPGYLDGRTASLEHMADLTGLRFGLGQQPWGPLMHLTDFEHPITRGLPQDTAWGTNSRLAPVFHLEDPEAHILGQVVYALGRCKPGLGVKTYPTWSSVYCATPNLPAPLWRGLARFAGVHLYSEAGDVLYATRQLLAVHTIGGGPRTFALPQPVELVYDLFQQCPVAQATAQFTVTLPPRSTALYYTGTPAGLT